MKDSVWLSLFVLFFCFVAASAQQPETADRLPVAEQRRIIEVLLNEKFKRSPEDRIYLSAANIPEEIQKDFPAVKNKTVALVRTKAAADDACAYEFGEFQFIDKFVSVTFGNCREGLAYDFVKDADGWKTVGLVLTRDLVY
jgi:hypothetical protein